MAKQLTRPLSFNDLGYHVMGDDEVLTHDYMALPIETSDPSSPVKGQFWYNSTDGKLKVCVDDSGTVETFTKD